MKTISFSLLLFTIIASISCNRSTDIYIQGEFVGELIDKGSVTIFPVHNLDYDNLEIPIDSTGKFNFALPLDKPSILTVGGGKGWMSLLLVHPGDNIDLTLLGPWYELPFDNDDNSSVIIKGNNFKGQVAFNQLTKKKFTMIAPAYEEWDISQPNSLITDLTREIDNDLTPFKSLVQEGEINKTFLETVTKYIMYQNAFRLATTIIYNIKYHNVDSTLIDQELNVVNRILESYPINSEDALFLNQTLQMYLYVYLDYQKLVNKDEFQNQIDLGLEKTYSLSLIKENTPPQVYERFAVAYLNRMTRTKGSPEDYSLYENFLKEFPNCPYKYYLAPIAANIEKTKEIYKLTEQPFAEEIHFVENYQDINSFDELISIFKGKGIYIDLWATWCSPCIYEIEHSSQLKEFASSNNIEVLYISLDKKEHFEKWSNCIKYYDIKGHHILVNDNLRKDLDLVIPEFNEIPRSLIVDQNGEIVEFKAKRPSEGDILIEQLKMTLSL